MVQPDIPQMTTQYGAWAFHAGKLRLQTHSEYEGKGKGHPRTGNNVPEGVKLGARRHASSVLLLGKRPGTHCTGGWGVPGPVWTVAENLV
jgi:hypothetical protein